MRVIAGTARSLPLRTPEGMDTRPTTDRIKETLFNMLQTKVGGSVFVDMFSGSGGIGIEAISRGANKAYFIEYDKKALVCIKDNLNFTKFNDKAMVINADACSAVDRINEEADIIFMDPPYESGLDVAVLRILKNAVCVTEDTLIIVEASIERDIKEFEDCGFEVAKEKKYKTNKHVFLYKKS
ncbi:MAG: 16S rRNA (guanine(966)-N(2))-methyltransferase RsmD [Lachnospiraceae bacterium]|nr:16S rRNA (guanine(966)-N(2))-methyltransferase RsmD [Lachnospiraceae bacterium]